MALSELPTHPQSSGKPSEHAVLFVSVANVQQHGCMNPACQEPCCSCESHAHKSHAHMAQAHHGVSWVTYRGPNKNP